MSKEVEDLVNGFAADPILLYIRVLFAPLLVVDWLFSLIAEITYAWRPPWNLGRVLYFMTRYTALVGMVPLVYFRTSFLIPPQQCYRLSFVCSTLLLLEIAIAECVMTFRVWALWNRSKAVGILLLTAGATNLIAGVATYMLLGQANQYITMGSLSSIIPGCFPIRSNTTEAWSFIPLIVYQTIIFALTAVKCVRHHRASPCGTSLTNTFYSDGIIYYMLLVVFSIANVAMNIPRPGHTGLPFPALHDTQFALHSVLSSRMLLHLRQKSDSLQSYDDSSTSFRFVVIRGSSELSTPSTSAMETDRNNNDWFVKEGSLYPHSRTTFSR